MGYARALLDAAMGEGRTIPDLVQWRHATKFSPEVIATLAAMDADDDNRLISEVYAEFKRMVDADDSIVSVTVTTAVEMDDDLRQKVGERAAEIFDADVYLVERIEPSILGGIILEGRGERYDASIQTQLTSVRRTLSATFMGGAS